MGLTLARHRARTGLVRRPRPRGAAPAISYGQTASYQSVAAAMHNPKAVRAVGSACATNPLPVVIPCHRVIRSDGQLGAYLGGSEIKHQLLDLEARR